MLKHILVALAVLSLFTGCAQFKPFSGSKAVTITPCAIWPDNQGNHIQAHGGGILKQGDTYYWFGEHRAENNSPDKRYVGCYASKDLGHWEFRGKVLEYEGIDAEGVQWIVERPKVFYNEKTKKFVMYVHIDTRKTYKAAEVGVFVSDKVDGTYQFVKKFQPLGLQSRDIGQFVDDDGSAYLIFESRPTKGFYIAKLSDDFLDVAEETCFIKAPLEGGALVHYDGLYYVIGSAMTGWAPNPNKYATAKSLKGPWSEFKDIAPPKTNTYGSQSTLMLKVVGTKKTTVIYMGDIWKPKKHWDGRYLWMPLEIGNGKLWLPEPREWTFNVKTGEAVINMNKPPVPAQEPIVYQ